VNDSARLVRRIGVTAGGRVAVQWRVSMGEPVDGISGIDRFILGSASRVRLRARCRVAVCRLLMVEFVEGLSIPGGVCRKTPSLYTRRRLGCGCNWIGVGSDSILGIRDNEF
jgi:hypothetical protein